MVTILVNAILEKDRVTEWIVVVVNLSIITNSLSIDLYHAWVHRRMLLSLPVRTGVVRQSEHIFVKNVIPGGVLKIDVVPPFILSIGRIVVSINIIAVRR